MATGLANRNGTVPAVNEPSPEAVEAAVINGDLERLAPEYRVKWYQMRCEAAGLNPTSRPFEYIRLSNKLTLYATKSCTDQLSGIHGLSHRIVSQETVADLRIVTVEVSTKQNRSTQDIGAVVIGGKRGEDLANAYMKAVTKAKRRATLSLCGLGDVIDESELDTVRSFQRCTPTGEAIDGPGFGVDPTAHHAVNHDNGTGHGSGAYANPETVKAYDAWLNATVDEMNMKWADYHSAKGRLDGVKDIISRFQLAGHLYKWAASTGLINAPAEPRSSRDKYAAVAWDRDHDQVNAEAIRYGREQWKKSLASLPSADADDDVIDVADDYPADEIVGREPGGDDE